MDDFTSILQWHLRYTCFLLFPLLRRLDAAYIARTPMPEIPNKASHKAAFPSSPVLGMPSAGFFGVRGFPVESGVPGVSGVV